MTERSCRRRSVAANCFAQHSAPGPRIRAQIPAGSGECPTLRRCSEVSCFPLAGRRCCGIRRPPINRMGRGRAGIFAEPVCALRTYGRSRGSFVPVEGNGRTHSARCERRQVLIATTSILPAPVLQQGPPPAGDSSRGWAAHPAADSADSASLKPRPNSLERGDVISGMGPQRGCAHPRLECRAGADLACTDRRRKDRGSRLSTPARLSPRGTVCSAVFPFDRHELPRLRPSVRRAQTGSARSGRPRHP